MRTMKFTVLAIAALMALTLSGCGSSLDSGGDSTTGATGTYGTDSTGLRYVGAAACIECHKGFTWSAAAVSDYLAGKHVVHSDHITQKAALQQGCAQCHDPIGDGPSLESLIDPANVPADGLAAVTCEACHGAGGQHYGVGPVPNPTPDYTTCGNCHATLPADHLTYHPEANNIVTDFEASRHQVGSLRNRNVCVKCHSDEGAKQYVAIDDSTRLFTLAVPVDPASKIQCRTCHNAHNPEELLEAATSSASAEYRTCTNCHQAHNATVGTALSYPPGTTVTATSDGASDTNGGQLIYHAARYERVITDTHYDDPTTPAAVEGYTMSSASERVCRDCHNVHSADLSINLQWAESAHGGEILTVKETAAAGQANDSLAQTIAAKAAFTDDASGAPAWTHYDWDASSRQSCQRCHTSTGLVNFMAAAATQSDSDPANNITYTPANNNFSHLVGWSKNATTGAITSSGQNEMLYCWACHSNNAGALRNPGPITEIYEGTPSVPLVTVTYPDIDGSNICMSCHLGRETGEVLKTKTQSSYSNLGFVNSHYLSAGGQLFATTGYEFTGRNYNNVSFFAHDKLGTADQANTGSNGPCVSCHMSATEKHLFLPVETDATGQVTAITASVCNNCHFGLSPAEVNNWKNGYDASLEALQAAMAAKGIHFYNSHPYFFTAPFNPAYTETGACTDNLPVKNWLTGGTSTFTWDGVSACVSAVDVTGTADTGMDNMGAAFNLNLLLHDPGGFAHNKYYVKGLIWDSLDWINDGVLDNDVPATLPTLGLAPATLSAAQNYLGTTRPGDTIRPAAVN